MKDDSHPEEQNLNLTESMYIKKITNPAQTMDKVPSFRKKTLQVHHQITVDPVLNRSFHQKSFKSSNLMFKSTTSAVPLKPNNIMAMSCQTSLKKFHKGPVNRYDKRADETVVHRNIETLEDPYSYPIMKSLEPAYKSNEDLRSLEPLYKSNEDLSSLVLNVDNPTLQMSKSQVRFMNFCQKKQSFLNTKQLKKHLTRQSFKVRERNFRLP